MGSSRSAVPDSSDQVCYANVIVPRHLTGPFTYRIPAQLRSSLRIGHRVLVPFGPSILPGAVTALMHRLPRGLDRTRLKEIRGMLRGAHSTEVPVPLLELSRRIAEEYVAPWGQCLRLVLPPVALSASAVRPKKASSPLGTQFEPRLALPGPSSQAIPGALPCGVARPAWPDATDGPPGCRWWENPSDHRRGS